MPKDRAEELLNEIKDRAERRARKNLEPRARAFNTSIDELINEKKMEHTEARRRKLLDQPKVAEMKNVIDRFKVGSRKSAGLGLMANIGGVQGDVEGARLSADAVRKSAIAKSGSFLLTRLARDKDAISVFNNKANDELIFREVTQPGSVENPTIRHIAKSIKDTYEDMRKLLNSEGADIGSIEDYAGKQIHDADRLASYTGNFYKDRLLKLKMLKELKEGENLSDKLREAAFQRWYQFIMPLIDDSTFDDVDDTESFMRSVFNNIVNGHYGRAYRVDPETEREFIVPRPSNYAKKISQERVIKFKNDGKSGYVYMKEYGPGSYRNTVQLTLHKMGSDLGILEKLGTNPRATFFQLVNHLRENYADEAGKFGKNLQKHVDTAKLQLEYLLGQYGHSPTTFLGKMLSGISSLTMLASLPAVTLVSIPDLAIRASKMTEYGDSYWNTYANFLKDMFGKQKEQNKAIADITNVYAHSVLSDFYSRAFAVDTPLKSISKFQQMFFKWNLLTRWDNAQRVGGAASIARALGRSKKLAFEELPESVQRNLRNYGITNDEWDLVRKIDIDVPIMKDLITPDLADVVPRETVRGLLQDQLNKKAEQELQERIMQDERTGVEANRRIYRRQVQDADIDNYVRNLRTKWSTFFQNEVDDLQIQPGVATTAALLGGDNTQSAGSMLRKMFAMFKYFGVESTKRTWGRMIYGHGHSGIFDMIMNGKGSRMQLLNFMVHSMVLAYIGKSAEALAFGKTPPDMTKAKNWADIFLSSGALGMYGSMLGGDYSSYGQTFTNALLGPVGSFANQIAKIISLSRQDLVNGNDFTNVQHATYNLIRRNTPIINFPFVRIALDYLFAKEYMEVHNPGYMYNMNQKLKKETGQHYLWIPQ